MASRLELTPLQHPVCQLGEAPLWDAAERALYVADVFGCALHRLGDDGAVASWETPARPGALALREPDGLIVGLATGIHAFDPGDGALRLLADPEAELPRNRYNDCTVDARGRLWIGSLDDTGVAGCGALYRGGPDGRATTMLRGVGLANGLGFSPDGRRLYFPDTTERAIFELEHDPDSGRLGERRLFASDRDCLPDGLAVDAEGGVWSAKWGGGRVVRYRPDATVERTIELPVPHVTSLAFGGERLDRLYVTTASVEADARALRAGAGQVFVHEDPGAVGLPARRCSLQPRVAVAAAEEGAAHAGR